MYKFKNALNKMIIIYHNDERHGITIANSLIGKGFENIFLLTLGLG